MATSNPAPDHLDWLVENRSKNQRASVRLYGLFVAHEAKIKADQRLSNIAQGLVAVAFSLWRAAFLSDTDDASEKTHTLEMAFSESHAFLGKMILDNAITYAQDRAHKNWTFVYYVISARYRLERIADDSPKVLEPREFLIRGDKENWVEAQTRLDEAISGFANVLAEK